jgi:hypothetical protein
MHRMNFQRLNVLFRFMFVVLAGLFRKIFDGDRLGIQAGDQTIL